MDNVTQIPGGAATAAEHHPSASEVMAELERIIQSPHFEASERRRAFLRFIVEETLAGRTERLKGYAIAIGVFGRDKNFDAQSDAVVRLEARRLRRDLDSYYVDAGSLDPVRISIPKGSYAAHFEKRHVPGPFANTGPEVVSPSHHPTINGDMTPVTRAIFRIWRTFPQGRLIAAILAGLAIVAIGLALWTGKDPQRPNSTEGGPIVVVMPFEALGPTENSGFLAAGLSQELISDLMRFPGFRLYTLPVDLGEVTGQEPNSPVGGTDVSYVVSGSVQEDADDIQVSARLVLAASGEVLWTATYNRPLNPKALIEAQRDLAGKIATEIGPPYGVVNRDLENRLATPAVSEMQSYTCVLRAYQYRRDFSAAKFGPVLECLEQTVRRDPGYAEAWAMLGWLYLDAGRYEFDESHELQELYEKALAAASRAGSLQPDNPLSIKALASIYHYMGRFGEAERLSRRAVELNPYDPDTLAQLGWRLAVRGNFEEGIPLLKRAIERTANPPGWYFHLVAIDLYLKRDYPQMLEVAKRSAVQGTAVSYALLAIANGELGNREGSRAALEKMDEFEPLVRDPTAYFRRHGTTDEITRALVAGLDRARRVAQGAPG